MRAAYGVLGIAFMVILGAAYVLFSREVEAPVPEEVSLPVNETTTMLTLKSPAFQNGEPMPEKNSCDGENINPELRISGVPEGAKSLVLLMDDPDIPQIFKESRGIEKFDHWVLYNIPADTTVIEEGSAPGSVGQNSRGEARYTGPCPPVEYAPTRHRYFFRLYAIDTELTFGSEPSLDEIQAAIEGHVLESTELMGTYDRAAADAKG